MEKLPFFYFKEHSSLDFGLYIKEKGVYKGAQRDVSYVSVAGRDGDVMIDNGRYNNVPIPYKLELLNRSKHSFSELAHLIRDWLLFETGYFRLWDTYDRDYFRLASYSEVVDIEQQLRDYGTMNITFNCKPYRYLLQGQEMISGRFNNNRIFNPEFHESKPQIKLFGSGNCTFFLNGDVFMVKDVDGYVIVDSEIMDCYKDTTPMNNKMVGEFPVLQPGENIISAGSGITNIELIPRWRTI